MPLHSCSLFPGSCCINFLQLLTTAGAKTLPSTQNNWMLMIFQSLWSDLFLTDSVYPQLGAQIDPLSLWEQSIHSATFNSPPLRIMESAAYLIKCRDPVKHVINWPSKQALALNWAVLKKLYGPCSHLKGDLVGKCVISNICSAGLTSLKAYPGPYHNSIQGCHNPSGLYSGVFCYHDPSTPRTGR